MFLVSQDALEAMFLWCLWALTKRRDNIVLADMVADMEVDKVAGKKKKRKRVANMELDMVADIEIDKVADVVAYMVADMVADIEIQFGERVGHGVGWAQTCLTRNLPGLHIF